jgi:hypothetical protein
VIPASEFSCELAVRTHVAWFKRGSMSAKTESSPCIVRESDLRDILPKIKSKHSLRVQWLMSDSCTFECIAMGISIAALICIAIVLGIYDEKPLSSWSHTISLNTVLSTLGTIMTGFMMIPIGSCLSQLKWL